MPSVGPGLAATRQGSENFQQNIAVPNPIAIDTIISDLHQRLPKTKLLLLAVLPSERSAWITETTGEINRMLAERYNSGANVAFLDLTALFMRGGKLNRDLFLDPKLTPPDPPLHPSADGQAIMAKAMEPMLATMLDDKPHS